ncbi:hypothetical protein [Paracoccus alcaliphilus]|uniref:hypothetical protein n=1 Tax=Paracoccus alcaliphilus TaxID=34002 RepID=UPI001114318B|nr:hypothetical protein [Paracoccus alcaliphilus]WCR16993.1 hypothetical protein JHW40_11345 [Paracoccus alcaliphilus]
MFEVGKRYEFRVIEGGDEVSFTGRIEKYEHPLLKLEDTAVEALKIILTGPDGEDAKPLSDMPARTFPGRIINVISPNFISAVIVIE